MLNENRINDLVEKFPKYRNTILWFSQNDPSKNNKYLYWMVKSYLNDISDAQQVLSVVEYFHKNNNRFKNKDIYKYTFNELSTEVETLINTLTKKDIKNQSVKLYEDKNCLVIVPKSTDSSCYYGSGTKWCTSGSKNNKFIEYSKENLLVYIMSKKGQVEYGLNELSKYNYYTIFIDEIGSWVNDMIYVGEEMEDGEVLYNFESKNQWDDQKAFLYKDELNSSYIRGFDGETSTKLALQISLLGDNILVFNDRDEQLSSNPDHLIISFLTNLGVPNSEEIYNQIIEFKDNLPVQHFDGDPWFEYIDLLK